MRISTRRTLLRVLTAVTVASAAAVVFLPAQASVPSPSTTGALCDISLATGCATSFDISQFRAR